MDVQLKELIDKIKNDGVKSAEESAKAIITDAESKAKQILLDAEKKANDLKTSSQREAELVKQSSTDAVKQAARDLVIDLKKEIEGIFSNLVKSGVESALTGEALGDAIVAVLSNWDKDKVSNLSVLLPANDEEAVKKVISKKLGDLLKSGLEIKPVKTISAGFKVSEKDGNAYYDFSAEGVGEMMATYLSPSLAGFVKDVKES
ncbi:MAG: V-type ATP synthase subunit E [Candidatus Delongbacteria bacterium]|nr:V-type ATP synthase subunit E [Candidatus Delongbacteria bacterium]